MNNLFGTRLIDIVKYKPYSSLRYRDARAVLLFKIKMYVLTKYFLLHNFRFNVMLL
jgi:hypothetical protein